MMKLRNLMQVACMATAALTAFSCSQEEFENSGRKGNITVNATFEGAGTDTRTTVNDEYKILWQDTDALGLFCSNAESNYSNTKLEYASGAGQTSATFNGSKPSGETAVFSIYPYQQNMSVSLALPQPETPSDGSYAFLGWAGRYDTAGGKVWTTVPDPLTADFAASIRPGDTGERSIVLRAAWRLTEQSRYPWSLTLDDGVTAVTYEAAVPMASGGDVYLCAYPQPVRDGYRFAGWLNAAGERVDLLPASAFFAKTADGETDWRTTVSVTLTADWEKA